MRSVLAGTVAALTAAVVALATASRDQDQSGHSSAGPATASSSSSPGPAPSALPGPPEEHRSPQPQSGTSLPRSEPVSSDAREPAAAVPTAGNTAPSSNPQRSDDQLAALQQLVAQSRQENEQLWQIDEQLALGRRQAADAELRREAEAEQGAAQHAATLQALEILRQAEALLTIGDYEGVDDELGRAEAALSGRTRVDVGAAREALGRSDLYAARLYLAAALAER